MILAEHDAKNLLMEASIPVIAVRSIRSLDHALMEAADTGYPVVLKISSSLHTHKTEVGGVILNIRNPEELQSAYASLDEIRNRLDPEAAIIMEEMAPPAAELFVGVQRHPAFGPVISMGMGGIWLELFQDVSFRLLPATRGDFREMATELKCWPKLVHGFRHLPPAGLEPLLSFLGKVGALVSTRPDILEMDLNPIALYPDRAVAVDARIVLG
jgi:succinyl-CoA synthetase beta subunit